MVGDSAILGFALTLLATGLVSGCRESSEASRSEAPPFVFRSLDLNQRRPDGQRDWDLTSPEARYELNSRTIRARRPKGILYRNNKPNFSISADLATVLNDGELVVLEGSVQLKQLQNRPILIQGDRLVWRPELSTMVMNQRPEALNSDSRLATQSLTFVQSSNRLEFTGPTRLYRWENKRSDDQTAETVIEATDGVWNLETGRFQAEGPIRAKRSSGRRLSASGLSGNTRQKLLDLKSPVEVVLEDERGTVSAGQTRWLYGTKQLKSSAPFLADLSDGKIRGDGFAIDERTTTAIIPTACRLEQPGESLKANRCSWNWKEERVVAEGDVELRRDQLNQITRASRLEGTVGKDGALRFGSPGERVRSRIRVESESTQQPRRPPVSF